MNRKGFTLIELLAVIVILAIILAIAVPRISATINSSTKAAFESDTKMLLSAIKLKKLAEETFDITTINETNVEVLLNIDDSNYKKLTVTEENGRPYVVIVGKNKWDGLTTSGTEINTQLHEGLLLWLDATNSKSYPGTGTTWYDLSGNDNNGTINGSVTWVSNGVQSYFNFPSNNDGDYIATSNAKDYKDIFIVFEPNYSINTGDVLSMLISDGDDKSIRFNTTIIPWTISTRNPGDANDWAYQTATEYYINGIISNDLPSSGWVTLSGYRTNYTVNFPSSFTLRISGGYTGRNFVGKVAFVAMYNRKLSEIEVLQMNNFLKSRFGI